MTQPLNSSHDIHGTNNNNDDDDMLNNNTNTALLPTINYLLTLLNNSSQHHNIIDLITPSILHNDHIIYDSTIYDIIQQYIVLEQQYINDIDNNELYNQYINQLDKLLSTLSSPVYTSIVDQLIQYNANTMDGSIIEYRTQYSEYIDIFSKQVLLSSELYKTYVDNVIKYKTQSSSEYNKLHELIQLVDTTRTECNKNIHTYDIQIQSLMSTIDDLQRTIDTTKSEFQRKISTDTYNNNQQFDTMESQLNNQYQQLQIELDELNKQHQSVESDILAQQNNKQLLITEHIQQYDSDINFYHNNYNELNTIHQNESNELHELTGYFTRVDNDTQRLTDEHRDIIIRRDNELLQLRQYEAIQSIVVDLHSDYTSKHRPKPVKLGTPDKKGKKNDKPKSRKK